MSSKSRPVILRVVPHLAAIAVIALCLRLTMWQLDREAEKILLLQHWDQASEVDPGNLIDTEFAQFSRVVGPGRFDAQRHILLDNQIRNNQPGVHVFSLFSPLDQDFYVLVNRGWQPWRRSQDVLPEVSTPDAELTLRGRVSQPPQPGLRLGATGPLQADRWPQLVTYLELEPIARVLDRPVAEQIILLDPDHPAHLSQDPWPRINLGPERHRAYAFQWAACALAVVVIWLSLTARSLRRK